MKYIELFVGTSQSQEKTLNYNLPVFVSTNTVGGQIFEYQIYGQAFYQFIGRSVKDDPSIYRESTKFKMDFIFTVGAEEFYTYYLINKPSTSINDNIPDYTNLSSGKGLFSSRSTRIYPDKELNNASRDSLIYGLFTRGLFH